MKLTCLICGQGSGKNRFIYEDSVCSICRTIDNRFEEPRMRKYKDFPVPSNQTGILWCRKGEGLDNLADGIVKGWVRANATGRISIQVLETDSTTNGVEAVAVASDTEAALWKEVEGFDLDANQVEAFAYSVTGQGIRIILVSAAGARTLSGLVTWHAH